MFQDILKTGYLEVVSGFWSLNRLTTTTLIALLILCSLLFLWRLWTFTILAALKPNEPRELPYWIPGLGHTRAFFVDVQGLLAYAKRYFHNTQKPFTLTVAGEKLYIITSPQDVLAVYKHTSTLTFDKFVEDLEASFGISCESLQRLWHPMASQHHLGRQGTELHKAQLHPGRHLEDMTEKFLIQIQQGTLWENLPELSQCSAVDGKMVSLYTWCAEVLISAATTAFFGETLLEAEPSLLQHFLAFDRDSWMLTYRYPRFLARSMYAAKDKGTEAFIRFIKHHKDQRPGACYYMQALETLHRKEGTSDRDLALLLQMFYWVTNANAFKICFWLLSYLLYDLTLLEEIRIEISSGISKENSVNIQYLLDRCPLLNSAFEESLRLTGGASSARTVLAPTVIGGKSLVPGTKVLLPYRQLHFDREVFGPDVDCFNPRRFLDNKSLSRSPSYRPFGGGVTYCSGRFIARREVLAFVALVLRRYDFSIPKAEKPFPRLDEKKPSLGVMAPIEGDDVVVQVKIRKD